MCIRDRCKSVWLTLIILWIKVGILWLSRITYNISWSVFVLWPYFLNLFQFVLIALSFQLFLSLIIIQLQFFIFYNYNLSLVYLTQMLSLLSLYIVSHEKWGTLQQCILHAEIRKQFYISTLIFAQVWNEALLKLLELTG